jgi:hypothetical protein
MFLPVFLYLTYCYKNTYIKVPTDPTGFLGSGRGKSLPSFLGFYFVNLKHPESPMD